MKLTRLSCQHLFITLVISPLLHKLSWRLNNALLQPHGDLNSTMKYYRQICLNTYGDSTTVLGMSPDFLWRLKAVAGEVAQNIGDYPNTGMVTYNCYLRGRQFLESFLKALLWLLKWSLDFFFRSVVSWWVDKLIDAIFGFNCALKEVLHAVKIKIGDYPRTHVNYWF